MGNERWPKLWFNATYHVFNEHTNTQWKWFKYIQNCLSHCGLDHLFNNDPHRNPGWVYAYRHIRKTLDSWEWLEKAKTKTWLKLYLSLKDNFNKEQYLLDSTNFQGVSLKLKARTNTLQLERYIRSWSPTNNGLCK